MTLAEDIYITYEELYTNTPQQYWENMATRVNVSVDILQDIFSLKDGELEELEASITEEISDKPVMQALLNHIEKNQVMLVEYQTLENIMNNVLSSMNQEQVMEIAEDEDLHYFTIAIAYALLQIVEELADNLISPNPSENCR